MKKYYIQREASGYVGNCLLWWKHNNCGYTCDLSEAKVFDENDPRFIDAMTSSKYRAWEKGYVDEVATIHVECENLDWIKSFGGNEMKDLKQCPCPKCFKCSCGDKDCVNSEDVICDCDKTTNERTK